MNKHFYIIKVNHELLHETKGKYQCPRCSYSVDNDGHLARHVLRDHPDEAGPSNGRPAAPAQAKAPDNIRTPQAKASSQVQAENPSQAVVKIDRRRKSDRNLPPKVYRCDHCEYSSPQLASLKNHNKRYIFKSFFSNFILFLMLSFE